MTDHDDELLRAALRAEADGVAASDDLLDRIHGASRRSPSAWWDRAPWLLAVAALAVVVGIAAAVLAQGDDDQTLDVVDDPTTTTTTAPAPGTRPAQAVAVTPRGHVVVIDTATGAVIRDLGGFDDPTDPSVGDLEGGPYYVTGVALHPNGRDVYFETCCEPASGAVYAVGIDGAFPIGGPLTDLVTVAFGYGIDISADGRWLASVNEQGVTLTDLDSGEQIASPASDEATDFVQAAVNADGTEVTVERALEYEEEAPAHRILRSELLTYRRVGDELELVERTGGDIRLLPIYVNGQLTQVAARDGVTDINVDASGRWLLATPTGMPLRGSTEAADEEEIPGGPYVAADW